MIAVFAAAILAVNPAVTQANIHQTICVRGWSASVRPSLAYTESIKRRWVRDQFPGHALREFELDHIVPIEAGGSPTSPLNLRLQFWPEAHAKDLIENAVHHDICAGRTTLLQGQDRFMPWAKQ